MEKAWHIAILIFLSLVFFSPVITETNSVISSNASDIPSSFHPYMIFLKNSLDKGLPLWNPLLMGGFPWFANPESAIFYPFTLIAAILFPPHLAINYLIIFNVILTGILMHLYLRELKIPSRFSLFGSIAFMFSGFTIARIYAGHVSILNSLVWIPLIFLLIERTVKTKSIASSVLLGSVFGLQLLGSQPQIVIYTLIASMFYFTFRHISEKTELLDVVKIVTITSIIFVGISAVQIIPSYELLKLSVRSHGVPYDQLTGSSLPPIQLISLILPEFFGTALDYTAWGESNFWELTGYAGVLTLVFAGISLYLKPDKFSSFFLAIAIFSILYSFGKFNPLFSIIQDVPLLNTFRVPSRFLLFFTFSISVMASIGLTKFFSSLSNLKHFTKSVFIAAVFTTIIIFISIVYRSDILVYAQVLAEQRLEDVAISNPISSTVKTLLETYGIEYFTNNIFNRIITNLTIVAVSLFGFTFVYFLLSKRIIENKFALIFILTLLLLDLWSFGIKYVSIAPISSAESFQLPKETYDYRILSPSEVYLVDQAELTKRTIQRFDGYYVAKLDYYEEFFKLTGKNSNLLEIGNVKYIFGESGAINVTFSLPRAFFVEGTIVGSTENQFDVIKQQDFDPTRTLVIGNKIIEIKKIIPLLITDYSPNNLRIEVNNENPGYLVLLDTFYPDWKAQIDGEEHEILRAYYIMRGVEMSRNATLVEFSFEPKSFSTGFFTTITVVIFSILVLFGIYKPFLRKIK